MSEFCCRCGDTLTISEVISVGMLTFCSLCAPNTEEEKKKVLDDYNTFCKRLTESQNIGE